MTFTDKNYCKITAKVTGSTSNITFNGVTPDSSLTPDNAKAQIDKIMNIVGKAVDTAGMTRVITQEATAE